MGNYLLFGSYICTRMQVPVIVCIHNVQKNKLHNLNRKYISWCSEQIIKNSVLSTCFCYCDIISLFLKNKRFDEVPVNSFYLYILYQ